MPKKLPIGTSDFKTIIADNRYFVDKSLFIKDVVDGPDILLFTRPRRFGKTLNLTMLKYFYDIREDNTKLFDELQISSEENIMTKQGKHPVIYISFKDIKYNTWEQCRNDMHSLMSGLFDDYRHILSSKRISTEEKILYRQIKSKKADIEDYANSFRFLSKLLFLYYKAKPVILIDEYDTPIHQGYFCHFYDEVISFMRVFFGNSFKDNQYLEKAVLTGILRTSKESLFSGLNNLLVCSISSDIAADKFGFTENEVATLLKHYNDIFSLSDIKWWYDGYNFGGVEIYNPWSILCCIVKKQLGRHWVNTSGNDLVRELCMQADETVKQDVDILAQGGSVQKPIDDNIIFADLGKNNDALWSFLLHCGYLRYDNLYIRQSDGIKIADLSVPNSEISGLFLRDVVNNWLISPREDKTKELTKLMNNLITGDIKIFRDEFLRYCQETISYFDLTKKEPERQYHMLLLGVLICLKDRYHIRSNRETGLGRCDVMLLPKGVRSEELGVRSEVCRDGINAVRSVGGDGNRPARRDAACCVRSRGIIFELKKVNKIKKETFESVIEVAKDQILDNRYYQELQSHGVKEIIYIVLAFLGKEMKMEIFT